MSDKKTNDVNVLGFSALQPPDQLTSGPLAASADAHERVHRYRSELQAQLAGEDSRLLVIAGPCSVHDPEALFEYAEHFKRLRTRFQDTMNLVMRVYFEKPRTIVGWKGLINDPHLNDSYDVEYGLRLAREVLLEVNKRDVPAATEFLDPIVPQYLSDLITWTAIGARTTESQVHREMASGLSMPVGFKNSTGGRFDSAVHAIQSAKQGHAFLGINMQGQTTVVTTAGNPHVHLVLRGGQSGPNYQPEYVAKAHDLLKKAHPDVRRCVLIDCSHGNSNKDYRLQPDVFAQVLTQARSNPAILGMMLESHLQEGKQALSEHPSDLIYGKSITDGCISIETTEALLEKAEADLKRL